MKINFINPGIEDVNSLEFSFRALHDQQKKLVIAFNMQKLLGFKEIDSISLRPDSKESKSFIFSDNEQFPMQMISSDPKFHIKFSTDYKNKLNNKIDNFLALAKSSVEKKKGSNIFEDFNSAYQNIKINLSELQKEWVDVYVSFEHYENGFSAFGINNEDRIAIPAEIKNCAQQICTIQNSVSVDKLKELSALGVINLNNLSMAQKILLGEDLYNQWIIENDKNSLEKTIALPINNTNSSQANPINALGIHKV